LGTSRFRSQTPMITERWTLPSRWEISMADPLVIPAQDSPRTSNGQALASTDCVRVWAPATWNLSVKTFSKRLFQPEGVRGLTLEDRQTGMNAATSAPAARDKCGARRR